MTDFIEIILEIVKLIVEIHHSNPYLFSYIWDCIKIIWQKIK